MFFVGAALVSSLYYLQIEVLLPNSRCTEGTLQHYSLHYNVALVSVRDYRARRPLNTVLDWPDDFKLAAVGRCFKSGALMTTIGDYVNWTGTLDCKFLIRSTCKITKVIQCFIACFFLMMIVNTRPVFFPIRRNSVMEK